MPLFSIKNGKLLEINDSPFKLERELQKLFENNLDMLMGLTFVKSEFAVKDSRIDTLAFDEQTNSFTIIEFKRDKNFSVVDQGFAYLALMLDNKAEFVLEYNIQKKCSKKRDDIDWSQSRVAFVTPSFTDTQVQSTNFRDLPIELWEVSRYENDTVTVKQVSKPKSKSSASFKDLTPSSSELKKVAEEVTVPTEEDLKKETTEEIAELYETFKSAILNLADGIECKAQKHYVSFKKKRSLVDIQLQKQALKLWINAHWGELDDSKKLAVDVSKKGHYGSGDYAIIATDDSQLEYIMSLVKQAVSKQ